MDIFEIRSNAVNFCLFFRETITADNIHFIPKIIQNQSFIYNNYCAEIEQYAGQNIFHGQGHFIVHTDNYLMSFVSSTSACSIFH